MKPRGNKEVKPQEEMNSMAEQSTVEGQQEAVKEAVLDGQEGNETPGNLEPENGEEKFQNLESSLADDEGLQAALNESGDEEIGAEFAKAEEPKGILVAHIADPNPPSFSGGKMAPAVIYEGGADLSKEAGGGSMSLSQVGPMPDGTTRVVITIQEGYWEAVKDWAEADGVPVQRWLSDRLYDYISTYGEPAKGR